MASPGYCKCEERTFLIKSGTQQVKGELRAEGDQRAVRRADTGCKGNHRGRLRQEAVGWVYVQLRLAVLRTKNRAPKPPEDGEWLCLASSLHARQLLFFDFNSWSCTRVRDTEGWEVPCLCKPRQCFGIQGSWEKRASSPRVNQGARNCTDLDDGLISLQSILNLGIRRLRGGNITESQWKFPWPFTR